jgi:hypothetical protein
MRYFAFNQFKNNYAYLIFGWALVLAGCQGTEQTQSTEHSEPVQSMAESDDRFYEMRIYYAAPGKLEALNARFRNHTTGLFEKHGMTNIGYWVPVDNQEDKLIYVLAYPSRDAREASWKAFVDDPQWQEAKTASEVDGKLVDRVESIYMNATDYSPAIQANVGDGPRVFEMRTYIAAPGKLDDLHARFRNHTVKLFSKHGMNHVGYWAPLDADKGADNTLVYILAHGSEDNAKTSFAAFREDPDWVTAKTASEVNGGLTEKVESVFMVPTDYSPTR